MSPLQLNHLLSIIYGAEEQTLVVTPEGAISGYSQDSTFLEQVLFEVVSPNAAVGNSELNLSNVSNSVLDQARTDVICFNR
ncbi:hypothetical protein [Nostoc sp. LPT]|uniref:hypothetical protein n=1 Tax=Nostoc sp. LPT TaxID=2815387 RepID=UPI001D5F1864|nr:hypothetical protein [Nostoc sp. LPT]MBN4003693.1 hypothetical protein [Nostoc sp. LPT]